MASVNLVMLLGNVGKGWELKYTHSGTAYLEFPLATDSEWTDAGGKGHKQTEWHKILVWDKLAGICKQWLKSGKEVWVEGKKTTRTWTNEDGSKGSRTLIEASTVRFIDSRPADDGHSYRDNNDQPSFRHRNA